MNCMFAWANKEFNHSCCSSSSSAPSARSIPRARECHGRILFPFDFTDGLSNDLHFVLHRVHHLANRLAHRQHVPGQGTAQHADQNAQVPNDLVAPLNPAWTHMDDKGVKEALSMNNHSTKYSPNQLVLDHVGVGLVEGDSLVDPEQRQNHLGQVVHAGDLLQRHQAQVELHALTGHDGAASRLLEVQPRAVLLVVRTEAAHAVQNLRVGHGEEVRQGHVQRSAHARRHVQDATRGTAWKS